MKQLNKHTIDRLYEKGVFSFLDIHFGRMMAKLDDSGNPLIFLAAALVSNSTRQGQVCLDISTTAGRQLLPEEGDSDAVLCPDIDTWISSFENSCIVGRPGEFRPLILDRTNRLIYLHRYFEYQEIVIRFITSKIVETAIADLSLLKNRVEKLFPQTASHKEVNWQKIAAAMSYLKKVCIISGGPGTGKTTTIVRMMALILEQAESEYFSIALLAPTGKAAMRLQQAVQEAKKNLDCPEPVKAMMPHETSTIHRALGTIYGSSYFKHNENNPLDVDMVIVDEASMVDLALMAKLIQALPDHASLVLVGDKDQLASVEAGAVFGDICNSGNPFCFSKTFADLLHAVTNHSVASLDHTGNPPHLWDCIVHFTNNYRFGADSGIGAVSRAVNNGDGSTALNILKDDTYRDTGWCRLPKPEGLASGLEKSIYMGFKKYLNAAEPAAALKAFDDFRILCALREGPYGVNVINRIIEDILRRENTIPSNTIWYSHRPVMITGNNYQLRLFNGDIGIVFPNKDNNNRLMVYFSGADNNIRTFYPEALSEHETVYAMTVHKSQGSEFENLILILPDQESPVLTRELIYTGITRTRKHITIWGQENVFLKGVSKKINRTSGLLDALSSDDIHV